MIFILITKKRPFDRNVDSLRDMTKTDFFIVITKKRPFARNVDSGHALAERTCQKWFARFKTIRRTKKFEDAELEAIFKEDLCQTQEELADALDVNHLTV